MLFVEGRVVRLAPEGVEARRRRLVVILLFLLFVANDPKPLGEQLPLALLLLARLDLHPVANEVPVFVSRQVAVVLHAWKALAGNARQELGLKRARASLGPVDDALAAQLVHVVGVGNARERAGNGELGGGLVMGHL